MTPDPITRSVVIFAKLVKLAHIEGVSWNFVTICSSDITDM